MVDFFFSLYWVPPMLICFGLVGCVVAAFLNHDKLMDVSRCLITWLTFFFLFPGKAKEAELIKNRFVGWAIALVSPPMLVVYFITVLLFRANAPLAYDELPFKTQKDMSAITEIWDFPEFEYESNKHDGWDGTTRAFFRFTDEKAVTRLMAQLEDVVKDKDNVYWFKDSVLNEENKKYFEADMIYVCERGWDGEFVKSPTGAIGGSQVRICVSKKGFVVISNDCWASLCEYATPDSLNKLVGVDFPTLEFVNVYYVDYFVDCGWSATARMKSKPTKAFLDSLEKAEHWSKDEDGTYHFFMENRNGGDLWENIYVDPKSRYVKFTNESY